jgi:uncharacterized iron-regulated membrane protein
MTSWHQWVRQPQSFLLRKAIFQVHLWSGLGVGLYIFAICVSGSVLVYRNELLTMFEPGPRIVNGSGQRLTAEELKDRAGRLYPDYTVSDVRNGEVQNEAVEVWLERGEELKRRFFDPFTGDDLGNVLPVGFRLTLWLKEFHDNLLNGTTGRAINGVGALFVVLLSFTGLVIWWPGISNWRRSLTIEFKSNWKRLTWNLHSALGFWSFGFILMWGITGVYLSFPQLFAAVFDYIEPLDEATPAERVGDTIQYWLAYLHFGRLGGRGIPGCGRGLCDSTTKLVWSVFGLVPPAMFVTGALMWWNRVIRLRMRSGRTSVREQPEMVTV